MYLGTIFFNSGAIIRFTLSFDVIAHHRNHIELYGSKGSILVPDPNMFGGSVYTCKKLGGAWKEHKTNKMYLGKILDTSRGRLHRQASHFLLRF